MESNPVEALGEALFILSDKLRASHFFEDEVNHAAYERVVAAFQVLDEPARTPGSVDAGKVEAVALADVANERKRQIDALGWTLDHDDEHRDDWALPRAAACYALAGTGGNGPFWIAPLQTPQQVWPYRWEWKPKDRRTNLVRSAALLIAEIERLDRAALTESPSPCQ